MWHNKSLQDDAQCSEDALSATWTGKMCVHVWKESWVIHNTYSDRDISRYQYEIVLRQE